MTADRAWMEALLSDLVRIDSVNPAFGAGASDESAVAARVASELSALGLEVERREPRPGRVSVVGRLPGRGGGRSLMLYSHLDTVGTEGMRRPLDPVLREGRLYGRGAYDMKGGLVACLAAVRELRATGAVLGGDLLVVAVADEEDASLGIVDVLSAHRTDAAVVTEPTELAVCVAHKGFCWLEVETVGRAAHGSRFEDGIDANMHMGRVLGELESLERRLRESAPHPLLGPPSLHAPLLQGGTGVSTYAARCRLEVERRTLPGETGEAVLAEIRAILEQLAAVDPTFEARARLLLERGPFEVDPDAEVVRVVERAAAGVIGSAPERIGRSFWMDAAFLAEAGVETVVIGPSGGGAHAAEEWVEMGSVERLALVLARTAEEYCG